MVTGSERRSLLARDTLHTYVLEPILPANGPDKQCRPATLVRILMFCALVPYTGAVVLLHPLGLPLPSQ